MPKTARKRAGKAEVSEKNNEEQKLANYNVETSTKYNILKFYVDSATRANAQYTVTVSTETGSIEMECNCGDQFGVKPRRTNCKHCRYIKAQITKSQENPKNNVKGLEKKIEKNKKDDNHLDMDRLTKYFQRLGEK